MRIGIVSDIAYPWVKGGLQHTEHIEATHLANEHEVLFFTLRFKGMKSTFTKYGIHYICVADADIDRLYVNGIRSTRLALLFARALPKFLSKYKLDAIFVNTMPYLHLPAVKRYCRANGTKLIMDAIEIWDMKYWQKYLGAFRGIAAYYYVNRVLKGADYYIANSSTTSQGLQRIGIEPDKIRVFSPVVDLKEMSRYASKSDKGDGTVIFAGRFIKEKRLDLWIDVVAKAHSINKNVRGLIIGTGPESDSIMRKIADSGYNFISVQPFMKSREKLYKRIAGASLLLNMSEREGLSAIAIESLALRTPVLLPSYTPIPAEVKQKCVVDDINLLPKRVDEMVRASKNRYLQKVGTLSEFDTGMINSVFDDLLGVH